LLADAGAENVATGLADRVLPANPRYPFGGSIECGDPPLLIYRKDALVDRIEDGVAIEYHT
jgi:hypothetical protein